MLLLLQYCKSFNIKKKQKQTNKKSKQTNHNNDNAMQ